MSTLAQTYWTITCKFCIAVRNLLIAIFVSMIALGESAGRARAAAELSRQGYLEEAKALMLQGAKKDV